MHLYCQRQPGKANIRSFSSKLDRITFFRRFPFDWKNPTGYSLAVLIEFTLTTYMSIFVGSLITIGIASFLFEAAIIEDIKMHLNSVDESSKSHEDRSETFKNSLMPLKFIRWWNSYVVQIFRVPKWNNFDFYSQDNARLLRSMSTIFYSFVHSEHSFNFSCAVMDWSGISWVLITFLQRLFDYWI